MKKIKQEKRYKKEKRYKRITSFALAVSMFMTVVPVPTTYAYSRTLQLEQAVSMAQSKNTALTKQYNQIILKKMEYVEAVESGKAVAKNKATFRWTPLLSFKFPESLDMSEAYDLSIAPLTVQTELETLQHSLTEIANNIKAEVSNLFIATYLSQEKITFTQEILEQAEADLLRNEARLLTGDATQADIDSMTKRVESITLELVNLKRDFESEKSELSDLIHLDVTSSYTFRNPMKEMNLPREMLPDIIEYTLDNSQDFYEAKATTATAHLNLNAYESLMKQQYGTKMNGIQTYINMARQGQDVDYGAFQLAYKSFLTSIDSFWNKSIKIWFFTFTMEWFKGQISGSRYIEDDMYAVYTSCMELSNAVQDQEVMEDTLRKLVASQYETIVTAWSSYQYSADLVVELKETLEKVVALNSLGKAVYSEVEDALTTYQEAQISAIDALATYNELINDFDALTCGAVTKYLFNAEISTDGGVGGDSYFILDVIYDPYYYVTTSVADMKFYVGVSIPDGFDPVISDFEVWNEGIQIGERTPIDERVEHLTLDYGGTSELTLRFYNGDEYVIEDTVDAEITRDILDLGQGEMEPEEPVILGTYSATTQTIGDLSTSELSVNPKASLGARSFTVDYGGKDVHSLSQVAIDDSFFYLTLLIVSLDDVEVHFYNSTGGLLTTGRFETSTGNIIEVN